MGRTAAPADRPEEPAARKRADARRNEESLLEAAAAAFVESGIHVPVRAVAARAGVGVGTIYRHFPTRADLVVAVYRHQVEACAAAGPQLLASAPSARAALSSWMDLFVDFLVTKHGLAEALQSDDASLQSLHSWFVERLVPVCEELLSAAVAAGEARSDVNGYELLRGIGNLCIGAAQDERYDARRLVHLLLDGLGRPSG